MYCGAERSAGWGCDPLPRVGSGLGCGAELGAATSSGWDPGAREERWGEAGPRDGIARLPLPANSGTTHSCASESQVCPRRRWRWRWRCRARVAVVCVDTCLWGCRAGCQRHEACLWNPRVCTGNYILSCGLPWGWGGAGAALGLLPTWMTSCENPEQGPSSGAPLTDLARREGRGAGRDSVPRKRLYFLKELGPKKGLTLRPTVTFIIGSGHCQSEFWGRVCGSVCGMPGAPHLPLTPHLASLGDAPTAPSGCRQFPGPGGGPWGVPAPAPASGQAA